MRVMTRKKNSLISLFPFPLSYPLNQLQPNNQSIEERPTAPLPTVELSALPAEVRAVFCFASFSFSERRRRRRKRPENSKIYLSFSFISPNNSPPSPQGPLLAAPGPLPAALVPPAVRRLPAEVSEELFLFKKLRKRVRENEQEENNSPFFYLFSLINFKKVTQERPLLQPAHASSSAPSTARPSRSSRPSSRRSAAQRSSRQQQRSSSSGRSAARSGPRRRFLGGPCRRLLCCRAPLRYGGLGGYSAAPAAAAGPAVGSYGAPRPLRRRVPRLHDGGGPGGGIGGVPLRPAARRPPPRRRHRRRHLVLRPLWQRFCEAAQWAPALAPLAGRSAAAAALTTPTSSSSSARTAARVRRRCGGDGGGG